MSKKRRDFRHGVLNHPESSTGETEGILGGENPKGRKGTRETKDSFFPSLILDDSSINTKLLAGRKTRDTMVKPV